MYLPKFLKLLGKTLMTIDRFQENDYYKKSLVGNNVQIKLLEVKSNHDYLLVNCFRADFIGSAFKTIVRNIYKTRDVTSESIKLSNSKKQFKGLDKFDKGKHNIAGISCKNNRYVYNDWIRTTFDPAIVDKNLFIHERIPCELMKFNWDVNFV